MAVDKDLGRVHVEKLGGAKCNGVGKGVGAVPVAADSGTGDAKGLCCGVVAGELVAGLDGIEIVAGFHGVTRL